MKNGVRLVAVLLCVASAWVSAEQVYRWKDASGKWHFSDVPPDGVGAEPAKFSNMSVVSMPKPVPLASAAEPGLPPECEPGYSGEGECPGVVAAPLPDGGEMAAEEPPLYQHTGEERNDRLETRNEQIEDYDKSKRVEEIDKRTDEVKSYDRDKPPTVNEKLRAKNKVPAPEPRD